MIAENISNGLRLIPNGVFVVASSHENITHGFTASWVSQASYRNPLLTVAIDKQHDTYQLIKGSGKLVINLLKASQAGVAEHFGHESTERSQYFRVENGREVPVLKDCLGAIFCQVVGSLDAKDHEVLLVEATDSQIFAGDDPLAYSRATGYARLAGGKG